MPHCVENGVVGGLLGNQCARKDDGFDFLWVFLSKKGSNKPTKTESDQVGTCKLILLINAV
ncbi:hypothetical protein D3C86_1790390 [compost metagenome]